VTFVDHLSGYGPGDWANAIESLTPKIHPIDLNATRVWFPFFPGGPNPDQVETSHTFLYGHRFWPQVKRAILAAAKEAQWPAVLPDLISSIAEHATRTTQVDRDQLLGITAASLLSLRRAGLDVISASSSVVQLPPWSHVRSIRQVRRARASQRWRLFGALFGTRRFRVRYSEASPDASCDVGDGASIGSALPAALQTCGASCSGACTIGVLGGAEYLSPMAASEAQQLQAAGQVVVKGVGGDPLIRLACHARPHGDVSIVLRAI
jgi:ferredoxin